MIGVNVRTDGITVNGHACYGPIGQDIVCAAVSALTQNLIESINGLTTDTIQYSVSPGRAEIHYRNLSEQSRTLIDSFFIGICGIASKYPDHVRVL